MLQSSNNKTKNPPPAPFYTYHHSKNTANNKYFVRFFLTGKVKSVLFNKQDFTKGKNG